MTCLLSLPAEVLHIILSEVDAHDLAAVNGTCQELNSHIADNKLLFRDHYLRNWDQPRRLSTDSEDEPAWEEDLKRYIRLKKLLASNSYDDHRAELPFICETIVDHLRCSDGTSESSMNVAYLDSLITEAHHYPLLSSSSLYALSHPDGPGAANTAEERQLTAKLHCYYGVPMTIDGNPEASLNYPMHAYARARVYDLRKYTDNGTFWGPFLDDGTQRVDWEKMESIMLVLHYNLNFVSIREGGVFPLPMWEKPFLGCTPYSYVEQMKLCPIFQAPAVGSNGSFGMVSIPSWSSPSQPEDVRILKEPSTTMEMADPYAIGGTWLRVVCFLDYSELFKFNFLENHQLRYTLEERWDLEPLDTEEAVRMIIMRLQVTKLRPPRIDPEVCDGDREVDWNGMPVAEFKGTSHSLHSAWDPNANSGIRGTVRYTPEGEIRWTTISVFSGEERWKSEGIQVGGPGSARGVLGNWFDKNFDDHGPAGPTAFWKWSDDVDDKRVPRFRGM